MDINIPKYRIEIRNNYWCTEQIILRFIYELDSDTNPQPR